MQKTIRSVCLWTAGFALLHSLLAARWLKIRVQRRCGARIFDGWFRLAYNLTAVLSFGGLLWRFSKLPDRTVYHVRRPLSLLMRGLQLAAVGMAVDANLRIGVGRMLGLQGAWQFVRGRQPIAQNPAQGPQLSDERPFRTGGAFRLSRHPNNLVPLLLWLANPKMTVRFAAFTAVSALYLVLGSVHEERRLRAEYGEQYDRYRAGIPFYLPWPR